MSRRTLLPGNILLRPLDVNDAPALLDAYARNREHLRPFDPVWPESFWTLEGQQRRLDSLLRQQTEGRAFPCMMERDGRVLGCLTLSNIVLGPLRSANLGYWVDSAEAGRGLTSAAVAAVCRIADDEISLHRLEAGVIPTNVASLRVLAKNGFERFGTARNYLHIAGSWQDCHLFQRVLNDRPPSYD